MNKKTVYETKVWMTNKIFYFYINIWWIKYRKENVEYIWKYIISTLTQYEVDVHT